MLCNSVVVARTRPRAMPLAMITMRKPTHGFPFPICVWDSAWRSFGPPELQALKTVFDYISKLLEVRQEYSASSFSFQTRFFMLDTLHMNGKQNRTTANRESHLFNPEYD